MSSSENIIAYIRAIENKQNNYKFFIPSKINDLMQEHQLTDEDKNAIELMQQKHFKDAKNLLSENNFKEASLFIERSLSLNPTNHNLLEEICFILVEEARDRNNREAYTIAYKILHYLEQSKEVDDFALMLKEDLSKISFKKNNFKISKKNIIIILFIILFFMIGTIVTTMLLLYQQAPRTNNTPLKVESKAVINPKNDYIVPLVLKNTNDHYNIQIKEEQSNFVYYDLSPYYNFLGKLNYIVRSEDHRYISSFKGRLVLYDSLGTILGEKEIDFYAKDSLLNTGQEKRDQKKLDFLEKELGLSLIESEFYYPDVSIPLEFFIPLKEDLTNKITEAILYIEEIADFTQKDSAVDALKNFEVQNELSSLYNVNIQLIDSSVSKSLVYRDYNYDFILENLGPRRIKSLKMDIFWIDALGKILKKQEEDFVLDRNIILEVKEKFAFRVKIALIEEIEGILFDSFKEVQIVLKEAESP